MELMARTTTKAKTTTLPNGDRIVRLVRVEAPDLEWVLQAAAVRRLRARPDYDVAFTIAGDFNAARRSMQDSVKAKATGLTAGEHDLRVYLTGGRLGLVEFKAAKGRVAPEQTDRHALLARLGFHRQAVVRSASDDDAADQAEAVVVGWLAERN